MSLTVNVAGERVDTLDDKKRESSSYSQFVDFLVNAAAQKSDEAIEEVMMLLIGS